MQHRPLARKRGRIDYAFGMIWTIAELIAEDMTITAYCEAIDCHRNQKVDLQKLVARLGPSAPAMAADLAPKLKCSKCGGKNVSLIYSPRTRAPSVNPDR